MHIDDDVVKIFSDRAFLPEGLRHSICLFPFWGDYLEHNGFHRFENWARANWSLTSIGEADIAVLPFDGREFFEQDGPRLLELRESAQRFVERAESAGLRTVVLVNSDKIDPLPLGDSTIVFRTSLDRQTRRRNEFCLSATHEDIVATHFSGRMRWRPHNDKPTVSFCGLASREAPPLKRRLKLAVYWLLRQTFGYRIPPNDGTFLRHRAMSQLESSTTVETNFVVRDQYFGGADDNESTHARVRLEYVENMLDSDYVLCVRGYGNFSFRFYEAMSLGRSPVLIDTQCVLPYDFLHDYGELCVIVPESEVDRIGDYVHEYHSRFTPETYAEQQQRIRRFWEQWLSPKGFFEHLLAHFGTEYSGPETQ